MARNPYLEGKIYEGKNLTEAQKDYNKAVRKFVKNRKQTFEKHGVKIELPKAPKELDSNAINRIENIRWQRNDKVSSDPVNGASELEAWFGDLISEATDYESDVESVSEVSRTYVKQVRMIRAAEYSQKIANLLISVRNKDIRGLYRVLTTAGRYSRLMDLAHRIYQVYNLDLVAIKERDMYLEQIITILNQDVPLSDDQLDDITMYGVTNFDYDEDEEEY